ncbi:MAG TPA: amidohydrolase [Candidatus Limnocylindrales bacterium]|nr:amidohydrolase [Candidatus Limnocylindrales bacterium]
MSRADLLVVGRIATLAGEDGPGYVEAVAIGAGHVIAAGSLADVDALAGPSTRRIDLAPDEVAIPGLTDSHLHLAETALGESKVDLSAAATLADGLDLIAAAEGSLPPDAWLEGHGWESDRWGGWPTAADLERVAPGRPAAIWAHDHHALWTSEAGQAAAGIDTATADPPGGIIRRDESGRPTGVLHEAASRLVTSRIPAITADDLEKAIRRLARRLLALGVVAVHDPGQLSLQGGLGPAYEAYRQLADAGRLLIRVHAAIRPEQLDAAIGAGLRSGDPIGDPSGRARVGWLKLFADGTLGSRTAALLEPIEPEPGRPLPAGTERGVFMTEPAALAEFAERAAAAGIASQIHAIGDHAVRVALDALGQTVGRSRLMPRLEHVQLVHPDDVARFGREGIAASVQPVHLRSDAVAARRLWGDRAERFGYTWATLARCAALLAFGTDAPVEPIDPWPGLAMAVTRSDPSWPAGTAPFGPAEALTLDQALRAATIGPALTAAESDRGRLTLGQRADLVVIPVAALREPVEPGGALATARPRLVLVDGAVAFEA